MTDPGPARGPRLLPGLPRESPARAVLVTLLVCAVCSAAIALAVSVLRPIEQHNRARDRQARVLELVRTAAGLEAALGAGAVLEPRVVELATGRYTDAIDPSGLDVRAAARDPVQGEAIPPERDLAGIGRRARHALVYLVRDAQRVRLIVLPVHGSGYVSTLYGHLALDPDGRTIRGLGFYEHAETPGLGSEIETPAWRALWPGKLTRDASGALRVGVAKGKVDPDGPDAAYQVDGITGATRTGIGVTNLLRFWLGPDGYGPYLERLSRTQP